MARAAPAATRAASILSFLTAHSSRGFTISELVSHLKLNIASAHATLAVLSDAGFTIRDPVHRTYTLGPALAATGYAALEQNPAISTAVQQAELLAAELDMEVNVTALAGRDVIFLACRGPQPTSGYSSYAGDRSPLLAPFGAVLMAWADGPTVDAWLSRAMLDPRTADYYRSVLGHVRARGFGVAVRAITAEPIAAAISRMRDQPEDDTAENELIAALRDVGHVPIAVDDLPTDAMVPLQAVTAPIFDPIGRVLLALSVTGPSTAISVADVIRLGDRVSSAAAVATSRARGRTEPLWDAGRQA